ncbi:MAG: hypothetical protein AAF490_15045 [Chloroflexota bacterium]
MRRFVTFLLIGITAVFLGACITPSSNPTPTPFTSISTTVTPNISAAQPFPVNFDDLVTNPISYEGARIQLMGNYQKVPLLICDGELFTSPVTWNLVDGNMIAPLGGFQAQVEQLIPEGLSMTVSGIWRRWHGPIGCGKEAINRDIWYLDVMEIESPNPLVRVTLTPFGEEIADNGQNGTVIATQPPISQDDATPDPTLETNPVFSEATETPIPTATPAPASSIPTPTAIPSATPVEDDRGDEDDDDDGDEDATAVPTSTEPSNNGSDPTATPMNPGDPTPTATSANTGLVTPTPVSSNNGTLLRDDYGFATLAASTTHLWNIILTENTMVTITVAMEPDVNPIISLIDPLDNVIIDSQDSSKAGEIEAIQNLGISGSGTYQLFISSEGNIATEYMVNYYDTRSSPQLAFEGILGNTATLSDVILIDWDDNWIFYAEENDIINVLVDPTEPDVDLFLTLWSKDGDEAESDEDIGLSEEIANFQIPSTGLYVLQIGEWDFEETGYTITFDRQ